ncbi:DUF1853 family protein [Psychrobacter frigidicola]|uniref:DUF1853 family protein n=1 Tax=Psychrobacter frigidicola TaxID=45611 RepID=A0A5C7A234_9GAMM|nr:DUF1853 family protein [Psychrobacter frigidicola]TXD96518.1 DUF1853 family protein [Psychrobacter frigidicola]
MTEPTSHLSSTLINAAVENLTIKKDAPWEEYKRPYVRDLAYALACPNVLAEWIDFAPHENNAIIAVHSASFWQGQYEAYRVRLVELDTTTAYQDLTRYLLARPSSNRLGFHFEGLLSFWLTDGYTHGLHSYEIIASNVQLFRGKQTTGELDLILYNHQEKLTEHWELAIKFFMGSAPFAPENWVGINSNDNLERKMSHMQTKQFCTVWVDTENHGQVKIDKRYAVIKGRFFLPTTVTKFIYPNWLAPSLPMHRWLAVLKIQNNRDDQPNSEIIQKQNQVSSIESIIEPLDGITGIRRAHYIEWFTQRDFYNSKYVENSRSESGENNKESTSSEMLSNHQALPQGLYFIEVNANQKRSSQAYYEPLVILQTNKDDGHDSLSN